MSETEARAERPVRRTRRISDTPEPERLDESEEIKEDSSKEDSTIDVPSWPEAVVNGRIPQTNEVVLKFRDAAGKLTSVLMDDPAGIICDGEIYNLSKSFESQTIPAPEKVERSAIRSLKATLKVEKVYTLSIDGKRVEGVFRERGHMAGMKLLQNSKAEQVVVDMPSGLEDVMATLFDGKEEVDVNVVKASPSIIGETMEEKDEE